MIWLFAVLTVSVVAVDLVTKYTIPGIYNSGVAWGFGAQWPWLWLVVVILSALIVILATVWYLRTPRKSWWLSVGLALFIGGVLGNAIDRIITGGAVHDFINFVIFQNNLADIAICVGALIVGVHLAFR